MCRSGLTSHDQETQEAELCPAQSAAKHWEGGHSIAISRVHIAEHNVVLVQGGLMQICQGSMSKCHGGNTTVDAHGSE